MTLPESFAAAAEAFVGTKFRLHGRVPATGVDCVGLVACALERAGRPVSAPSGYSLRNRDIATYLAFAERNGFSASSGIIRRGDLLLVQPGPAQHHLLVATSANSFVHAHASLRRAVHQRGPLAWTPTRHWRLSQSLEN